MGRYGDSYFGDEMAALKNDGTIWKQSLNYSSFQRWSNLRRVGNRSDWIAVAKHGNSILALAKDGTFCIFGEPWQHQGQLLASTRRVTWSANVLESPK